MIKLTFSFITALLLMIRVDVTSPYNGKRMKLDIKDDYVKNYFDNLLASMVKLNRERLDTIHKLSQLQGTNVGQVMLRRGQNSETSDEYHKHLDVIFIRPRTIWERKKYGTSPVDVNFMDETTNGPELEIFSDINFNPELRTFGDSTNNNLRASKSCNKAVRRRCTEACKKSFRVGCLGNACRSRIKNAYKKECKRSCRSRFNY